MTQSPDEDRRAQRLENGRTSFWHAQLPAVAPRPPLGGDLSCDVVIIGGGLTGLWTAYYLKRAHPVLDVVVVEARTVGYGASGRNGGWLSSEVVGSREVYAAHSGREAVLRLSRAMEEAVDEVIGVCEREGIDADVVKGGSLAVARSRAQLARLEKKVEYLQSWGAERHKLTADEVRERVQISGVLGAAFTPHCARVQPLKLTRGVAEAAERLGVRIVEHTTCTDMAPRTAITDRGTITARAVLRCLEGFTASLPGLRRESLPMNSSMIVTDPLPDVVRDQLGWGGMETVCDVAHAHAYLQHTADGRIALGGRGVPYRYGSRTDRNGETQASTVTRLIELLAELFPAAAEVPIAHTWSGVLGVPRDWCAAVNFDAATGLGSAGGYVGSGLTTTNLAARSLAGLVGGDVTPETTLPWVGRRVRRWEPEPLRWLGVQAIYTLYRAADRGESRRGSPRNSAWAGLADKISGR